MAAFPKPLRVLAAIGFASSCFGQCNTVTVTNLFGEPGDFRFFIQQSSTIIYSTQFSLNPSNGMMAISLQNLISTGITYRLSLETFDQFGFSNPFSNYQISLSHDLAFSDGTQVKSGFLPNAVTVGSYDFAKLPGSASACACTLPRPIKRLSQSDPTWGTMPYAQSSRTISALGCALTSLTMAMNYSGNALDPGTLNLFALHQMGGAGYGSENDVDWTFISYVFGNTWDTYGGFIDSRFNSVAASQTLDNALCSTTTPVPIIVGVTGSTGRFPGHYVLVTGKLVSDDGTVHYSIADPAQRPEDSTARTLDFYSNRYQTRGSVRSTVTSQPVSTNSLEHHLALGQDSASTDIFVGDNASLLLTNTSGQQTGLDPVTRTVVNEIPNAAYYEDALDNDVTPEAPYGIDHSVNLPGAGPSTYHVVMTGLKAGPYVLSVRAFEDGAQRVATFSGNIIPGGTLTLTIGTSGTGLPKIMPIYGDLNGDGVVNCTDIAIVKAAFGKKVGQEGYDPRADINADGAVDIRDLAFVTQKLPAGTRCR